MCGGGRSPGPPLKNTHNALPRWCLCDRHHPWCVCEGAGRPWTWLCGRRAAAEARRPTEAHTREEGRTSRITKISGLGCQQTPSNNHGRRVGPSYRKAAVITAINRHRRLWANGELPVFSGQPATALQQLKRSMRQKRNGLGLCAATGPCNPRATHTDGPMTERRLRVQVALAQPPGIDAGCLVSAGILGLLVF